MPRSLPPSSATASHAAGSETDLATLLDEPASRAWYRRPALWAGVAAARAGRRRRCGTGRRSSTASAAPSYTTQTVARGNLTLTVTANGTLQPTRSINIGSELSGTVLKVNVDVNDRIKKGQVLVELDTVKLHDQILRSRAALAAANAKVAQTVATVKEAQATLARFEEVARLSGGKVPSKTELDSARATLERAQADEASARASVNDAQAALSTDEINLSKASIRAPTDGVVLTRSVDPGNAVAASLQAVTLFTVAEDLTQLRLQVYVDEADVGSVKVGQKATLHRQRLPEPQVPGADHPRGLRLDHHRQRRHLPHLPRRGQHRPEPAPRHDGHRDDHRDAAQRRAAGAQHRAALRARRPRAQRQRRRPSGGIVASLMPRMPAQRHAPLGRGRRQHRGGAPGLGAARRRSRAGGGDARASATAA